MDSKHHTTVALPDDTYEKAKAFCGKRGIKMRWLVKTALEAYMKKEGSK